MKKLLLALLLTLAALNAHVTQAQTWTMFSPGPFGQICKSDTTWVCQQTTAPDIAATYFGLSGCTGSAALLFNSTCAPIPTVPTVANPSASVGLTAVNGSTGHFMDAGSAPPLSQSISPAMTGNWAFQPSGGTAFVVSGASGGVFATIINGSSTNNQSDGERVNSGTQQSDYAVYVGNEALTQSFWEVRGDGSILAGAATGGVCGLGCINMRAAQVQGVPVATTQTGTFSLTYVSGCTVGSAAASGQWTLSGHVVVLNIVSTTLCTSTSSAINLTGLPAALQPARNVNVSVGVSSNSLNVLGYMGFAAASAAVAFNVVGNFAGSNSGPEPFAVTYSID